MANDLHVQSEQGLQIKFDFWISAEISKKKNQNTNERESLK